jgi:hypothetical protein
LRTIALDLASLEQRAIEQQKDLIWPDPARVSPVCLITFASTVCISRLEFFCLPISFETLLRPVLNKHSLQRERMMAWKIGPKPKGWQIRRFSLNFPPLMA